MKSVTDLQPPSARIDLRFFLTVFIAACFALLPEGRSDSIPEDLASKVHFRQELGFRLIDSHWKGAHCLVTGPDQSVYVIGSNKVGRWEVSDEFEARAKLSPFESVVVEDFWDWKEAQHSELDDSKKNSLACAGG
jgi:hypothetical protein